MPTRSLLIPLLLVSLLTSGCSDDSVTNPPVTGDTITVTFQDGVSPVPSYFGTRDAVLKNGPTGDLQNGNFGQTRLDTVGMVYAGTSFYERRMILRFDLSIITGCLSVIDASISVHIVPDCDNAIVLEAYGVTLPAGYPESWPEGTGGTGGGVAWLTIDGGAPWDTPGGDLEPLPLDEVALSCDSVATFALPGDLVLDWINNPQNNDGIIIKGRNVATELFRELHLREADEAVLRPVLRVTYLKGGG